MQDNEQIEQFIETLFEDFDEGEIYFDEFMKLSRNITSELFFCIYDCIYQYVPCVQTFLLMRENYIDKLIENKLYKEYNKLLIFPPITKKNHDRITEIEEASP